MSSFFQKNKMFLIIIIVIIIIGTVIYFFFKKSITNEISADISTPISALKCQDTPNLPNNALKLATKVIDGDTFLIEGGGIL